MKNALGETQKLRAGCSKAEQKNFALSQGGGQNLISCMFTTFTYRPSLVKIDARNFELSWQQTHKHTHTPTNTRRPPACHR